MATSIVYVDLNLKLLRMSGDMEERIKILDILQTSIACLLVRNKGQQTHS